MFDLNASQAEQLLKLLQYTLELAAQQHRPERSLERPPESVDPLLAIWPHFCQANEHLKNASHKKKQTQSV